MTPRSFEIGDFEESGDLPLVAEPRPLVAVEPTRTLFGRDREIYSIRSILHRQPLGGMLLFAGDSGSGKSALIRLAAAEAASCGHLALSASCEQFNAGITFFLVRELIRQITASQPPRELIAAAFGPTSFEAEYLKTFLSDSSDRQAIHEATIATFVNLVVATSRVNSAGIVLVLDDLDHVDSSSADALVALANRLSEAPLALIGSYRSDLVDSVQNHPILPLVSKVRLSRETSDVCSICPLPRGAIQSVVEQFLGGPCSATNLFFTRLVDETEGNPLFIREVLHSLTQSGPDGAPALLVRNDAAWNLTSNTRQSWRIPETIEAAIEQRLSALSETDRTLLNTAAVIGSSFRFETLLGVSGTSEDDLLSAIERFIDLNLIREVQGLPNTFAFRHVKVAEVVAAQLSAMRRVRLHSRIADQLLTERALFHEDVWAGLVGDQLFDAARFDEAIPHLLSSGTAALEARNVATAVAALTRCLDAHSQASSADTISLCDVQYRLADAYRIAGLVDEARAMFTVVSTTAAPSVRPARWALNQLGDLEKAKGRIDEAIRFFTAANEAAAASDDTELLAETAGDLAELYMRQYELLAGVDEAASQEAFASYRTHLTQEISLAQSIEDSSVRARALRNQAKYERVAGDPERAIQLYEASIACGGEDAKSHRFLIPYAKALKLVGRTDDAIEVTKRVLAWSTQLGVVGSEGIALQYLGLFTMELTEPPKQENLAAAREALLRSISIHRELQYTQGIQETATNLVQCALLCGDLREADRWLSECFDPTIYERLGDDARRVTALGERLRANGEPERAALIHRTFEALAGDGGTR